jgi:hypothetical protein
MKSKKIFAVVSATAVLVALASPAQATEPDEYYGYTEAEFVAAAQETTGLSLEEATAAWENPAVRERTLVESTETVTESPATPATAANLRAAGLAGKASPAGAAASMQKTFTLKKTYSAPIGACIDWTVTKTFLYDNVRAYHDITSTTSATACGWNYAGIGESSDQYGAIGGIPNSKSVSIREGLFSEAFGGQKRIKNTLEGRYNGVTNSSGTVS